MIFETKQQDLIIKIDRILEVEKGWEDIGIKKENNDPYSSNMSQKPSLRILSIDTQRIIKYNEIKDRDEDYNNLKKLLNDFDILNLKMKELEKNL